MTGYLACQHLACYALTDGTCGLCADLAAFAADDIAFDGIDHCGGQQ